MKLKIIKTLIKWLKKKLRNQKKNDQIKKKTLYITNYNWRIKLKTNKSLTKEKRQKIKTKRTKYEIPIIMRTISHFSR
jgi:hypothetical protein